MPCLACRYTIDRTWLIKNNTTITLRIVKRVLTAPATNINWDNNFSVSALGCSWFRSSLMKGDITITLRCQTCCKSNWSLWSYTSFWCASSPIAPHKLSNHSSLDQHGGKIAGIIFQPKHANSETFSIWYHSSIQSQPWWITYILYEGLVFLRRKPFSVKHAWPIEANMCH